MLTSSVQVKQCKKFPTTSMPSAYSSTTSLSTWLVHLPLDKITTCRSARVGCGSATSGSESIPQKMPSISIFFLRVKKYLGQRRASPLLLQVRSTLEWGRVRARTQTYKHLLFRYVKVHIIGIILFSKDSSSVNAWSTPLSESCHKHVYGHCRLVLPWLVVPCWLFCNPGLKNCWHGS